MTTVVLPREDGSLDSLELNPAPPTSTRETHHRVRSVYAAAHVVPLATGNNVPGAPADLDWDATIGFRRTVWSQGFGVAEAMDTAQRNMGLDYKACQELIERSAAAAREFGEPRGIALTDLVAAGVNTDQLAPGAASIEEITEAYLAQLRHTESTGVRAVIMASRHLAAAATSAADYEAVYKTVLEAAEKPVILHWLGAVFDAQLEGYFGSTDIDAAMDTVAGIIERHADKVAGIKMSLLDADAEIRLRDRLPEGVRMYTGDDFNYVDLIKGNEEAHSDALLGAFAAVTPAASRAISALEAGDLEAYEAILRPTEKLSRHVFAAPTQFYKTGVAFLAWLNGYQQVWSMVGGLHSGRSLPHLAQLLEYANDCGALVDPELAADRWTTLLKTQGITTDALATAGGRS